MKLYKWCMDYGRHGSLDGLFALGPQDEIKLQELIASGREIYFGEVLGKHSEVEAALDASEFEVLPIDEATVQKLVDAVGSTTISGMNPLGYVED